MARGHKIGIDYFSHDVDMCQDKKVKLIMAKYGLDGYGVYNRLLEDLYREKGYYLEIDEDYNILFSNDNNLDIDVYINILNDCIKWELFNSKIYKEYNVLTSERVQRNYLEATKRRSKVEFIKEYLILSDSFVKSNYSKNVNVCINRINVDINSINDDNSTQSKVKESKEKEKKKNKEEVARKKVIEFYDSLDGLPGYRKITAKRKKHINARIKEDSAKEVMEVIKKASESSFLKSNIGGTWYNFDWIFNPNNFVKIQEGKFTDVTNDESNEMDYEDDGGLTLDVEELLGGGNG